MKLCGVEREECVLPGFAEEIPIENLEIKQNIEKYHLELICFIF